MRENLRRSGRSISWSSWQGICSPPRMHGDKMGNKLLKMWCLFAALAYAQTPEPADTSGFEFFEAKIRPVLAKNCYVCHSAPTKVISAGLQLDTREGLRKGGVSGPAIIPGRSSKSLLIRALHYQSKKMPPSGQLPEAVLADFER